jgi:hypothetical protein
MDFEDRNVEWIYLARDMDHWLALVDKIMNLGLQKRQEISTSV